MIDTPPVEVEWDQEPFEHIEFAALVEQLDHISQRVKALRKETRDDRDYPGVLLTAMSLVEGRLLTRVKLYLEEHYYGKPIKS